jgi:hypothetical protein
MSNVALLEENGRISIKRSFGLWELMIVMALVAVYCSGLFIQNEWVRASLGTITAASILNAMLAAIYSRGERRVFALSYFLGAVFFPVACYGYMASLPFLLTQKLYEICDSLSPGSFKGENFWIVATVFWLQFSCTASGFLGLAWHRSTIAENSPEVSEHSSAD